MNFSPQGCFVTGTDTGVGKTCVSAALLRFFGTRMRTAGYKPVAAGATMVDGAWINEDVHQLRQASSLSLFDAEVGPCQFTEPCAPHIAGALEQRVIDRHALVAAARQLQMRSDFVVVEGVGGFCVPLGTDWDSSHLACALGLPVVLVVGLRLGCLNHALLTAEAIRARHLQLAGWVANTIDPQMAHRDENVSWLRQELARRYQAPCLGEVPWLEAPEVPEAVIGHLDARALEQALDPFKDVRRSLRSTVASVPPAAAASEEVLR
jgi:dethiobiotin synthetase